MNLPRFTRTELACVLILAAFAVWALWPDSPEQQLAKSHAYLDRVAHIICQYQERHQRLPSSIEGAMEDGHEMLPHRGDYHGKPIRFIRGNNSSFFLRGSDAEVFYIYCHSVSRAEYSAWWQSHPDPFP